jgi:hypothetical protein
MLSTVYPRLGGRALVFAPCERLGDPAREVRYRRKAAVPAGSQILSEVVEKLTYC